MSKRKEDEQHVLETERIVIKDEVIDDEIIDPMLLDQIKTEPQDCIEFEETKECDTYSTISIDGVESCKVEEEDFNEQTDEIELNLNCDKVITEGGVIIEKIYPDDAANKSKEENVPETHCHICNKEFRRHSALIGHIQTHFDDDKDYDCDICDRSFKTKFYMQRHREVHFRNDPILKCGKCYFTTKNKEQMNVHRIICKVPEILYKCRSCKFETGNIKAKDEHLKMHELQKNKNILYKCRMCNYETKDIVAKTDHMKIHVLYKCRKCPYETRNEQSKHLHEAAAHVPTRSSPSKNYQCGICSEKFSGLVKFFAHRKVHNNIECKECGQLMANQSNMLFHRLSHVGESSKVCLVCGSSFSMHSIFDIHENFHKQKLSCKCDICGKQFVFPSQLFAHQKERHTRETGDLQAKISSIRSQYGKTNYICKVCGIQSNGIVEYSRHKLSHLEKTEDMFKCRICGVNVKNIIELIKHRKTHN